MLSQIVQIGQEHHWQEFAETVQDDYSPVDHKRAGLRMRIANNWAIYEKKFKGAAGSQAEALANVRHWTLPAYLRYKLTNYTTLTLT